MKSRLGCGSKQLRSSKSQMKRRAEHIAQPVSEFAGLFMVRLSFVCASNNSESAKCYVVMVPVSDEVLSWVHSAVDHLVRRFGIPRAACPRGTDPVGNPREAARRRTRRVACPRAVTRRVRQDRRDHPDHHACHGHLDRPDHRVCRGRQDHRARRGRHSLEDPQSPRAACSREAHPKTARLEVSFLPRRCRRQKHLLPC